MVGWPTISHNAQDCNALGMMRFSIFFPFLLVFLVALTGTTMGVSLTGVASQGVIWVIPVEVMPGLPSMDGGTKYHTGTMKAMFGNVIVSKTFFDTKLGGGYKNGVWAMA